MNIDFTEKEFNVMLGTLNCYVDIPDLPNELKEQTKELRKKLKPIVKKQNT